MFNTFEPELLRDAIGADRCSFRMPFVQKARELLRESDLAIEAVGIAVGIDSASNFARLFRRPSV